MHGGQGLQYIQHLSPIPLPEPWAMVCGSGRQGSLDLLLIQNAVIGPFDSIWALPPLSECSLLAGLQSQFKLFNFTEISSTRGVDLSPQGWVTIRANYRKCHSEAILPLWRPGDEKSS